MYTCRGISCRCEWYIQLRVCFFKLRYNFLKMKRIYIVEIVMILALISRKFYGILCSKMIFGNDYSDYVS